MPPVLPVPANDDFRPENGDLVARYFATRPVRRALTTAASCIAAAILTFTIIHAKALDRAAAEANLSASSRL